MSKINEFELDRYINFFTVSYRDDLENCEYVKEKHPRWSIISGYYAMHDITKLFFAKKEGPFNKGYPEKWRTAHLD